MITALIALSAVALAVAVLAFITAHNAMRLTIQTAQVVVQAARTVPAPTTTTTPVPTPAPKTATKVSEPETDAQLLDRTYAESISAVLTKH